MVSRRVPCRLRASRSRNHSRRSPGDSSRPTCSSWPRIRRSRTTDRTDRCCMDAADSVRCCTAPTRDTPRRWCKEPGKRAGPDWDRTRRLRRHRDKRYHPCTERPKCRSVADCRHPCKAGLRGRCSSRLPRNRRSSGTRRGRRRPHRRRPGRLPRAHPTAHHGGRRRVRHGGRRTEHPRGHRRAQHRRGTRTLRTPPASRTARPRTSSSTFRLRCTWCFRTALRPRRRFRCTRRRSLRFRQAWRKRRRWSSCRSFEQGGCRAQREQPREVAVIEGWSECASRVRTFGVEAGRAPSGYMGQVKP